MKIVTRKRVLTLSILLSLLLILVILVSITMGSVKVPPFRSIRILFQSLLGLKGAGSETERTIILSLRLPRAILAGFVGAGLSVSGATFQALLRNPLADPYILGVSSGAAVGAIIAILLGLSTLSLGLPVASFLGALLTVFAVFSFGWFGWSFPTFSSGSFCSTFTHGTSISSSPVKSTPCSWESTLKD